MSCYVLLLPPPEPRDRLPGPRAVDTAPPVDVHHAPRLTGNGWSLNRSLEPRRNTVDYSQPVSDAVVLNASDAAEQNAGTHTSESMRAGQHRRPLVPAAGPDPPVAISRIS